MKETVRAAARTPGSGLHLCQRLLSLTAGLQLGPACEVNADVCLELNAAQGECVLPAAVEMRDWWEFLYEPHFRHLLGLTSHSGAYSIFTSLKVRVMHYCSERTIATKRACNRAGCTGL